MNTTQSPLSRTLIKDFIEQHSLSEEFSLVTIPYTCHYRLKNYEHGYGTHLDCGFHITQTSLDTVESLYNSINEEYNLAYSIVSGSYIRFRSDREHGLIIDRYTALETLKKAIENTISIS